jgi:hypothetical protein
VRWTIVPWRLESPHIADLKLFRAEAEELLKAKNSP